MNAGLENKIIKRRIRGSYLLSIFSISLVLFLIGIVLFLVVESKRFSNFLKENIVFTIDLDENLSEPEILMIQKLIEAKNYVKESVYITADETAKKFSKEIGEDFMELFEANPFPPSIEVKLFSNYLNNDSLKKVEEDLSKIEGVKEIYYQKSILHLINENVRKISLIVLLISSIMFLIALTLINNTIRLLIYSKRFIIRTMQLVGASNSFIRRPFLIYSFIQGIVSSIISIFLIYLILKMCEKEFDISILSKNLETFLFLSLIIFITGICINFFSTFIAVNKYLYIETDKLY